MKSSELIEPERSADIPLFMLFIGFAEKLGIDYPLYVDSRVPLSLETKKIIRDGGWREYNYTGKQNE